MIIHRKEKHGKILRSKLAVNHKLRYLLNFLELENHFIDSKILSYYRKLVLLSRGEKIPDRDWEKKRGEIASGDDISVITVSLKEAFCLINNKESFQNAI